MIAHDYFNADLMDYIDNIFLQAIAKNASDIHIETYQKNYRIRFRQDGLLFLFSEINPHLAAKIITRLKILAQLDITERRLPQDGHFQINYGTPIDIRMNSCPTLNGEKIVLRILDVNKISLNIATLGLTLTQQKQMIEKISAPSGLILVTGPTGSGKTITLYAALNFLNTLEKNISSVEDPVEIQLPGINQVSINPKIGFTFPIALRTFLRQDPDVLMIGEIRDKETAEIALHAAHTGHLVLATLHTTNSNSALVRLKNLGLPQSLLENTITLIISQRLIRKLCLSCKSNTKCQPNCTGYQGRIGIFECYDLQTQIDFTLQDSANEKIKLGLTNEAEVKRVLI